MHSWIVGPLKLRKWAALLILALAPGVAAAQSQGDEHGKKDKTPSHESKEKKSPPKHADSGKSNRAEEHRPLTPPPQSGAKPAGDARDVSRPSSANGSASGNAHANDRGYERGNSRNSGNRSDTNAHVPAGANTNSNASANAGNSGHSNSSSRSNSNSHSPDNANAHSRSSANASASEGQPRPPAHPFVPPSGAKHEEHRDGGHGYARGNQKWETNSQGHLTHFSEPGREARFSQGGRITYVHDDHRNVTVHESVHGGRVVETVRPGGVRVVSYGPRHGFVETRIVARPGFVQRTYVVNNVRYVHVYHSYVYRNIPVVRYIPAVRYAPAFYVWAYRPWGPQVIFSWGWGGAAWFGYYGYYFAPAPYYPTPAYWLTDYIVAENLRLAYENRQLQAENRELRAELAERDEELRAQQQNSSEQLSPEIKQQIAEEVQRQLEAERTASEGSQTSSELEGVPPALDPNQRTFIVSSSLDVDVDGQPCSLTAGDVLTRLDDEPGNDGAVQVMVSSSKRAGCRAGSRPRVQVSDLQEMHNDMRASLERGMQTLSANQGKNGLPAGPTADPKPFPTGQALPDSSADAQLQRQRQDADRAVEEVKKNTGPNSQ